MDKKTSEFISAFLNFLTEAQSQYRFCSDEVNNQDKLTQDYLHSLELDGLKCNERSKVATQLAINRKNRRYYKSRIEEFEPIVEWVNDPQNKKTLDRLTQVLGATRKAEDYHKYGKYVPRVLKENKNNA